MLRQLRNVAIGCCAEVGAGLATLTRVRRAPVAVTRTRALDTRTTLANVLSCYTVAYRQAEATGWATTGSLGPSRTAWLLLQCAWRLDYNARRLPGALPTPDPFIPPMPTGLQDRMLAGMASLQAARGRALTVAELAQLAVDSVFAYTYF